VISAMKSSYGEVAFRHIGSVHVGVWDSNVTSSVWITYEEMDCRYIGSVHEGVGDSNVTSAM